MVICCVVGCGNRSGRNDVAFYSIPSEKRDRSRRHAFIWAAGRVSVDSPSKAWKPTADTRICSFHFVGGRKSEDPNSKAYVPTENLPVSPMGSRSFWSKDMTRPKNKKQLFPTTSAIDQESEDVMPMEVDEPTLPDPPAIVDNNWFGFLWACLITFFLFLITQYLNLKIKCVNSKVTEEMAELSTDHAYSKASGKDYIQDLEKEKAFLQQKIGDMETRMLLIKNIKDEDKIMKFYTSLPNYGTFKTLFEYLQVKASRMRYVNSSYESECNRPPKSCIRDRKLDLENEFLMTLVRLKQGLFEVDLARNFGISQGHCSKIVNTWLDFLYCELRLICMFPSATKVRSTAPKSFHKYPHTRIVLDCTEEFIETPSNINASKSTYSHYKSHHTMKFLIGMAPNGYVSFISPAWGGRASDKLITEISDLYTSLDAGDSVMVDRGFDIEAELKEHGVTLNIPAFKGQRAQLDATEVHTSLRIAQVRIHVERLIGRIKTFHILDRELRLSMHDRLEQIFVICAYLTNFQTPIIKPEEL